MCSNPQHIDGFKEDIKKMFHLSDLGLLPYYLDGAREGWHNSMLEC